MERKAKNINPFTDFGFKKLFGEEASKDILLDFLNAVLEDDVGLITDLEFSKNEHLGPTELDRNVVFDIFCRTVSDERIIIEMQKFFQTFFKERSLFYSSFAIQEQAVKGQWDFSLFPVYCISLLDFTMNKEDISSDQYFHKVKLMEVKTASVFNDKLSFVYLEIPKFNKKLDELETNFDKWMYLLTKLEFLERLPDKLQSKIFEKVMGIAELVKLEKTDRKAYEESLKKHRDLKNAMDTQRREGFELGMEKGMEKGIEKGQLEKTRLGTINLFKHGVPIETIAKSFEISEDAVRNILRDAGLNPEHE